MSKLQRKQLINIGDREYMIEFPNTGKLMDIELLKLQLSDNRFENFKYSVNPMFVKQATRIETIATFSILIPEIKKDLNVKSMLLLGWEHMEELEKAYVEQFLPWYEEWLTVLTNPKVEEKQEDEKPA